MGVDLKIYPSYISKMDNYNTGYSCLSFEREGELFNEIQTTSEVFGGPLQKGAFLLHREKPIKKDPYGDVLRSVPAGELYKTLKECNPENWQNKAIMAFLKHIPKTDQIILYWC